MQHVDLERKQTSAWPWLSGLLILGLIIWAVTSLLAAPANDDDPRAEAAAVEELAPSALPMPVNPVGITPLRDVRELSPLGADDVGETVRANGEVLATGTEGFWMLAGREVVRVESDQIVRKGQLVQVNGTLHEDDPERTERIAAEVISRAPDADAWRIARGVKLVEGPEPGATAAAGGGS